MIELFHAWKNDLLKHKFKISIALLFLGLAFLATLISSNYVDEVKTVAVPDLLLDSIPTIDLSLFFVWGVFLIVAVFILYPLLFRPERFHYALGMLSLFLLVRSAFVILTHMRAPVGAIQVTAPWFLQFLTYSNDLFFSGHTGLPFLGFLIFDEKWVKYFMLAGSIVMAITVLLMHVHYSIDVASAFFITYGVYVIGDSFFGAREKN